MIDGVNDRDSDARELAALCRRLRPARPRQPDPAQPDARAIRPPGSSLERVDEFRDLLERSRGERHRAPEPRHRDRRGVRPARRRPTGRPSSPRRCADRSTAVSRGSWGWRRASLSTTAVGEELDEFVVTVVEVAASDRGRQLGVVGDAERCEPLLVGALPGRGPSSISRSTMPSTFEATRAWNRRRPSVAGITSRSSHSRTASSSSAALGASCGAVMSPPPLERTNRSYSFSQTRRPIAASSWLRAAPLRCTLACTMHIIAHFHVPSTSHQCTTSGSTGRRRPPRRPRRARRSRRARPPVAARRTATP